MKCKECGAEFESAYKTKLYCNIECKEKYNSRKASMKKKAVREATPKEYLTCGWCGESFEKPPYPQKFCCAEHTRLYRLSVRSEQSALNTAIKKKHIPKPSERIEPQSSLSETIEKAKEKGLSYGMYVGLFERGRIGRVAS